MIDEDWTEWDLDTWIDYVLSYGYDHYDDYWKYSGYGGAIYCQNNSSPLFINCSFDDNRTYGGVCGIGGEPWITLTPDRNQLPWAVPSTSCITEP